MGLLDSIFSAVSGAQKPSGAGEANPLLGVLSGLLTQSGGLQGLASKFSQSGQGDAFSSWVGMGENQPISSNAVRGRDKVMMERRVSTGSERVSVKNEKLTLAINRRQLWL